jgi:tripartite-type tricarboxylate transporter receptor subunit TctC
MMTHHLTLYAAIAALFAAAAGSARAQAQKSAPYPSKAVRVVVGYAPGGATDIVGRLIAQKLSEATGQTFIVENRPGASATIAAELVARAVPDGYTLFIAASASHSIMPSLIAKLPYDVHRDFAPISMVALSPQMMVVHPSLPVRTVADMIKFARAQPGQLAFGSGGTGTPPHLAGEMFQQMAGVKLLHVPYKGEAPALTDLIGGQLSLMFSNVVAVLPQVQSGRLRGIAATSANRVPTLPQYPTIGESGLPGYATDSWFGLVATAGTPAEVLTRLHADSVRGLAQADVRERLAAQGLFVKSSSPAELSTLMQTEFVRWAKVIKTAGIKIE